MSCCGGNCGCGSSCGCGNGCRGCKMFADVDYEKSGTGATLVLGFGAEKTSFQGLEMAASSESGCKCGANCTCDPCTCK